MQVRFSRALLCSFRCKEKCPSAAANVNRAADHLPVNQVPRTGRYPCTRMAPPSSVR